MRVGKYGAGVRVFLAESGVGVQAFLIAAIDFAALLASSTAPPQTVATEPLLHYNLLQGERQGSAVTMPVDGFTLPWRYNENVGAMCRTGMLCGG